jgi:putative Mg2+ transporter-C (MgtC) family protein
MDTIDIALRLGAALCVGGALGLNRHLHHQPTGLRTLSLVGLGSALAVMAVTNSGEVNAISRIIQGVLTGVGFLGAGVIVSRRHGEHIHGLTTAACTWLTACVGVVCGVAEWRVIFVGVPLVFVVLLLGGRIEKEIDRRWGKPSDDGQEIPPEDGFPTPRQAINEK